MLRSSFHPILDRWLLLLSCEGQQSGRIFTTPVMFRRTDDGVVLLAPERATNWWQNFRGGHPIAVLFQGTWHRGEGVVGTD